MSPFSLNCVKQESPCNLETSSQQLKVTTEPVNNHAKEPAKENAGQVNAQKLGPFKVAFVKLAKWQRVPILRAEVVETNRPEKCTVGHDRPMRSITEGGRETKPVPAVSNPSRLGKTLNARKSPPDTVIKDIKVHRSRSCSEVDYTEKLERDQVIRRSDRHKSRVRSHTNTGGIIVRKSAGIKNRNVFVVNEPSEHGSANSESRNAVLKSRVHEKKSLYSSK